MVCYGPCWKRIRTAKEKQRKLKEKESIVNRKEKEEKFYGFHQEERMGLPPSGMKREEREEKW